MDQGSSFLRTLYPLTRSRRPCLFWRYSRCRIVRNVHGNRLNGTPPHCGGIPTLLQLARSSLRHLDQKSSAPITRIATYSSCIREQSNGTIMFESSQTLIGSVSCGYGFRYVPKRRHDPIWTRVGQLHRTRLSLRNLATRTESFRLLTCWMSRNGTIVQKQVMGWEKQDGAVKCTD
jgi:hypothetical protein